MGTIGEFSSFARPYACLPHIILPICIYSVQIGTALVQHNKVNSSHIRNGNSVEMHKLIVNVRVLWCALVLC